MKKRTYEKDPFRKALLDMKKEGLSYPVEFDNLIKDQDFENPGFKKSFNFNNLKK